MSILRALLGEFRGMFLGDASLSLAILCLVAACGLIVPTRPMLAGMALLLGCLCLLVFACARARPGR
jgi:hypothetical protein